MRIKIKDIIIQDRDREYFDQQKMKELVESIQQVGLITPIAVSKEGDKYRLIAGERRVRAHKELGYEEIEAHILSPEDELEAKIMELAENVKRQDLTPREEVEAILRIHEFMVKKYGEKENPRDPKDPGWSIRRTSEMVGKSVSQVSRDLKLALVSESNPEIWDDAKDKRDAHKAFRRIVDSVKKSETAARIEEKIREKPEDIRKKELIESYIVIPLEGDDPMKGGFFKNDIPDGVVDLVELDPPYGDIIQNKFTVSVEQKERVREYNEIPSDLYPKFMKGMISEAYRILRKGGWLVCWFAPEPWFEDVYKWIREAGFDTRRLCGEWIKRSGQSLHPEMYLANSSEWFFYAKKGNATLNKPGRMNVFDYRGVPANIKSHPTERPIEMMEDILYTFVGEGSYIVVPCAGSGNTMLAASNIRCTSTGYDVTDTYRKDYIIKVNNGKVGEYTSYSEEE